MYKAVNENISSLKTHISLCFPVYLSIKKLVFRRNRDLAREGEKTQR